MDDKEIAKKINAGGILAQVSFEVIGNPKEHVEKALQEYLANIKKDSKIHFISEDIGEAEEIDGGMFSTFADTELLVESIDKFNWLCVNFMPASIEIIAPEELKISDKDLTLSFNDLLSKLHEISTKYRQLSTKEEAYVKNMNAMLHNAVVLAAEHYHTAEAVGKKLGLPEAEAKKFLDANVKNGKLMHHGDEYRHR